MHLVSVTVLLRFLCSMVGRELRCNNLVVLQSTGMEIRRHLPMCFEGRMNANNINIDYM